jgi:hypothetical protein
VAVVCLRRDLGFWIVANLNNPAGRLRYWFDEAQQRDRQADALAVWAEVLTLDISTVRGRLDVFQAGAALMDLAEEVRAGMAELPAHFHAAALMADFDEVDRTLSNFFSVNGMTLERFFSQLQATGRRSLEYADLHLSTQRAEVFLDDSGRDDLLDQIRAVIDAVMNDKDLKADTRLFVIGRLRSVEGAVTKARLNGIAQMEAANDSLIGGILRHADLGVAWFKSDTGKRVAGLVVMIAGALGLNTDHLALPGLNDHPAIEAPATPGVEVNITVNEGDEEPVVDAEIVEDENEG